MPDCHSKVPVFCDDEQGSVLVLYQRWTRELVYFERNKREDSHPDMPDHVHSHIKLIASKPLIA